MSPYMGDQEHWYGSGDHRECKDCGHCKECGFPRNSKGCEKHPTEARVAPFHNRPSSDRHAV